MNNASLSRPAVRNYKGAIDILNSRRRIKRPNAEPATKTPGLIHISNAKANADLKGMPSIVGMREWLAQIGHSAADIDGLNVIHVAGTKGKGSSCAFIESFLRTYGKRTGFPRKTGLYTSPHLIYPEERIRLDFQPIARDLFVKYFFEVWDALSGSSGDLPRYLQLLALVSFHAFIKEGVEAAVIETHHGGEYDATNIIDHPVATVITPLGMDHVQQLGPTIKDIAWHKSGIFKPGSPAISPPQDASAADMLRSRAAEKAVGLQFVENDPSLPEVAAQLSPDVQRMNCSVALAAVRRFLQEKAAAPISLLDISQGVAQFSWPGRFQLLVDGPFNWFLDGAHNEMSITKAAEWFVESSQRQGTLATRILIFSQVSDQRDGAVVLERLAAALRPIHIQHAIFTTYDPKQDFNPTTTMVPKAEAESQEAFGEIWKSLHPNSRVLYKPNIQQALDSAKKIGAATGGMQTLITGSQHLVGGALFSLGYHTSAQESTQTVSE